MNDDEADDAPGIPEWVVTFGDMMSLLLTFFIMLVSLSEIKEEESYQAMVESVRQSFGHDLSQMSLVPGAAKPRNSAMSKTSTMGRSRKLDIMRGGNRVEAPIGEEFLVRNVRAGNSHVVDSVIYFDKSYDQLTEPQKGDLQKVAEQIGGKPHKIELRGHTTYAAPPEGSGYADNWQLAQRRCQAVLDFLVKELNVDPQRIRISAAGPHEPLYLGTDLKQIARNQRVEIRMLEEYVEDLRGSVTPDATLPPAIP